MVTLTKVHTHTHSRLKTKHLSATQITISEGPGGRVVTGNLSSHLTVSGEVAQSLLFQGSTCHKMAETSGHPLYEQCDQCPVIVTAVVRSPDIVINFFTVPFVSSCFDSDIYIAHASVCVCACVAAAVLSNTPSVPANMKRGGSDQNVGGSCTS